MFKQFLVLTLVLGFLGVGSHQALAQAKYSIKQMTPQVQSALDNRRERFDQLRQLKSAGVLGENNKGYVEALKSEGDASSVAQAENQDRKVIYQTIAEQNGLDNELGTIEAVFGQVQRDKAGAGDKVQTEAGDWVTK